MRRRMLLVGAAALASTGLVLPFAQAQDAETGCPPEDNVQVYLNINGEETRVCLPSDLGPAPELPPAPEPPPV